MLKYRNYMTEPSPEGRVASNCSVLNSLCLVSTNHQQNQCLSPTWSIDANIFGHISDQTYLSTVMQTILPSTRQNSMQKLSCSAYFSAVETDYTETIYF